MDPASPHVGNESPPTRTTILSSFLRGRPRGTSQNNPTSPVTGIPRDPHIDCDDSALPPLISPNQGNRRRSAAIPGALQPSASHNIQPPPPSGPSLNFTQMLRRRRSAGNIPHPVPQAPIAPRIVVPTPSATNSHRIRFVPHLDSRRSLRFEPICRDLKERDPALRIGRFTDRSGLGLAATNALSSNKLAFKSKVVSRAHAEVWVEGGGRFMIKDTKSSSGTFLNHVRLSPAGNESKPHQLKDGDILQLGVDYQGGAEDIYKSVKIRIELGREWQAGANVFNTNAFKQLNTLAAAPSQMAASKSKTGQKSNIPDCCICLFSVTIRQALFIAPCSHTFHYKCIRPLLDAHHPAFSCPLCRTFADLEEDVEVEVEVVLQGAEEAEVSGSGSNGEGDADEGVPNSRPVTMPPIPIPIPAPVPAPAQEEREREAGIETEVENDTGVLRVSYAVRQPPSRNKKPALVPSMYPVVDLTEDVDEGMLSGEFGENAEGTAGTSGAGAGAGAGVANEGEMDVDEVVVADGGGTSSDEVPLVNGHVLVDSSEEGGFKNGTGMDAEGSGGEGVREINGVVGQGDAEQADPDDGMIGGKRKR